MKIITEQLLKEKLEKEKQALEENYSAMVQSADKYFKEGDYSRAKTAYNSAIGIISKPYAQEQIRKIDKLLSEQILKENIEKQKQAQQLAAEKLEKERQESEDTYAAAVSTADTLFKQGDYVNAKMAYNKALNLIARDWPKKRIEEINKLVADQFALENAKREEKKRRELEIDYNAGMQIADKFFKAGDYTNARIAYTKAAGIIPTPQSQEQIKKLDRLLGEQVAQATADRQRKAEEAEINSRYKTLIKNAEQEFDEGNYIKAKKLYSDAAGLKPQEGYPKESLVILANILAKVEPANLPPNNKAPIDLEIRKKPTNSPEMLGITKKPDNAPQMVDVNKQYNLALSNGKASLKENDLLGAKSFYEEAMSLKLSEEEPKKQLSIINEQLAKTGILTEIDSSYETKILLADSQLIHKAYDSALFYYAEAALLKPDQTYPKLQVKFVKSEIIESNRAKAIAKREDDEQRYKEALGRGEKSVAAKKFREAKAAYLESVSIHPQSQYAQSRLKIVTYQVVRARADKLKQLPPVIVEPVAPPVVKSKKKGRKNKTEPVIVKADSLAFQADPLPYSIDQLKSKFPGIDFSVSPPEQTFNKTTIYSKEKEHIYDTLLLENSRIDSSGTNQDIKIVLQGINFGETVVYMKLLVRNFSEKDFLIGAMMLNWTTKAGKTIKLDPYYLLPSPLPVIKPGHESVIIYALPSYDIADEDRLTFSLGDRLEKVKLQVQIPGTAYNREWAR
ncbi:MAG: hypothetical protein WKI04_05620 [Ferruginibacter sp.]